MSGFMEEGVGRVVFPARLVGSQVFIEVEKEGIAVSGVNGGQPMTTTAIRDLLDLVADVLTGNVEGSDDE